MSSESSANFWIAFVINFFLPGGGHLYAGDSDRGTIILIINIVCWALTPALVVTVLGVLGTWIYALVTTQEAVEERNKEIEKERKKEIEKEKKRLSIQEFVGKFEKAQKLKSADIISEEEFLNKKDSIIRELSYKKIDGEPDDILLAIAPLKQGNVLEKEEVDEIKKYVL